MIRRVSKRVDDVVSDVVDMEQRLMREVRQPVFEAAASISGLMKGVQAFASYFMKRKQ